MTQIIIDQTEQQPTYQRFQLVWAKILGWPWWPARITRIPFEKHGNYRVQFFADTTHAFLSSQKLTSFVQGRDRYSTPKVHYRNFTKALGLANKLLQSTTITKDDLQSECSSKEKVVAQQIQIINNSQQAKTETKQTNRKIQQQNKISVESLENSQAIRKPKSTFRRLQRSYLKHKQQMHKKTQQEVSKLLIKYKLELISDRLTKKQRTKFMKKRKLIAKNRIEYLNNEQLIGKLTRMIFKALSTKKIDLQQRYKITLTLKDSFFKNKEKGVEGIHRALFQWIRCNDSQTIQENYNSWPTDIKSDPFTDYS